MALDRTKPRTDVAFLRRRPHSPESVSKATATPVATTGGLSLSGASAGGSGATSGISLRREPSTSNNPAPTTGKINLNRADRPKSSNPAPATGSINLSRSDRSTQTSPAPTTGGLSLRPATAGTQESSKPAGVQSSHGRSTGSSLSLRPKMDADLPKHSVPYFHNNLELSLDSPVIRLDFRQSGIGSLVIEGAQAFAWETADRQGGLQVIGGEGSTDIKPPSVGNRPLAEFQDEDIVIGLRHADKIRRIVIASQTSDLKVRMYDGSEIFMPSDGGNNVLLLTRIGHEIECRMEKIDSIELLDVFAIKISHVSQTRDRP